MNEQSKHPHSSLSEVHGSVDTSLKPKGWRRLFSFLGPAYLVSVGYMDPGNWATDLAGGSKFGYTLIWVLLMSNLMALLLQGLSANKHMPPNNWKPICICTNCSWKKSTLSEIIPCPFSFHLQIVNLHETCPL